MNYKDTTTGIFLSRPNRFLAHVLADGREVVCHVKNTGRLRELLLPGAKVALQRHPDAAALGRKTEYSLIGVKKETPGGKIWVNIDSQAPNAAAYEWFLRGVGLPFCPAPQNLRREVRYGNSRFDLAFTDTGRPWFTEVKGVTLEQSGIAMFPDAPTERGVKHLEELSAAVREGYGAAILFVIQMKGVTGFTPNRDTHPEFAEALRRAKDDGVHVWACDCIVTESSMTVDRPVKVLLS